jgi:hypothetical protein
MSIKTTARKIPTKVETAESDIDAMCCETGPDGYPVGCNDEGDLVQIINDEQRIRAEVFFRGEQSIALVLAEFSDRTWRHVHREWLSLIATGDIRLTAEIESELASVQMRLRDLDVRYGKDDPPDDFARGMTFGKLQVFRWLGGAEWASDEFMSEEDAFVTRRSRRDVSWKCEAVFEMVWWNRHDVLLQKIPRDRGDYKMIFANDKKRAHRIEKNTERKISNLVISNGESSMVNYTHLNGC